MRQERSHPPLEKAGEDEAAAERQQRERETQVEEERPLHLLGEEDHRERREHRRHLERDQPIEDVLGEEAHRGAGDEAGAEDRRAGEPGAHAFAPSRFVISGTSLFWIWW